MRLTDTCSFSDGLQGLASFLEPVSVIPLAFLLVWLRFLLHLQVERMGHAPVVAAASPVLAIVRHAVPRRAATCCFPSCHWLAVTA